MDGAVYALVSSPTTQVNARFTFLSHGRCPNPSIVDTACWTHPGSYLSAVSVLERVAGWGVQRLRVESGGADSGFASVTLNGQVLDVSGGDAEVVVGHFRVQLQSSHRLTVRTALLTLVLDNSDGFINQQVTATTSDSAALTAMHGLLGQTASGRLHKGVHIEHVEGDVDDYVVSGLEAHDFAYDRFTEQGREGRGLPNGATMGGGGGYSVRSAAMEALSR